MLAEIEGKWIDSVIDNKEKYVAGWFCYFKQDYILSSPNKKLSGKNQETIKRF